MTSSATELYGKKLELLKDAFPKLSKVAFIWSSTNPSGDQTKDVETLARALRLNIQSYEVKEPDKIDGVFQSAKNYGAHVVLLGAGAGSSAFIKGGLSISRQNTACPSCIRTLAMLRMAD